MCYEYLTLQNGIRSVFKKTNSEAVHIGLFIGVGSRNENKHEQGLAHFIEHTIFKGTTKRKAFHVLSYLENIGGEINAYTSREETCIYTSIPLKHIEKAIDLISDIFSSSTFPEKELNKEKDVVIEEIRYYKDIPDESIFDDFEEYLYSGHPLGRNILGTEKNIKSFNNKIIKDFISRNYRTTSTVISCTGNINSVKWNKLVEKYFSSIPYKDGSVTNQPFKNYKPFNISKVKKTNQLHCVLGNVAYDYKNPKRQGLVLLNNMLGGPGNSSRLSLSLRERNGLSYNVQSNYSPYSDTGTFSIYFGVESNSEDKALSLIHKELAKLRDNKLGILQLHRAKQQLTGQTIIALESNLNEMLTMGKSMLLKDEVQSIKKITEEIEKPDAGLIQNIAQEIFAPEKLSSLIFKPAK